MTDIATLGFAVDTGGLVKGEARLDGLAGAAKRAEAAAQGVAASVNNAGAVSARAAAGVQAQATAMNTLATSAKMAAFQQRNLVFQLNDVAVSLASGMNPLMVAAQQGSQIATIYSAQEGGVARAFQETGKMALAAASGLGRMILAHPIATAGALALGGALAGIVEDLHDAGHASIGYSDVFVAAMQVAASGVYSIFKPAIDFLGPYVGAAWDWIADKTKWLANGIVNTFSAGVKIVGTVFGNLPTIAGAAAIGAANAVIAAIESMVNGASSLLNSFIGGVNQLTAGIAAITGGEAAKIGDIGKVSLGRIENPYAGQAGKIAADLSNSLGDTFGQDPVGDFIGAVKARAIANDQAEQDAKKKGGRGRSGGRGRAERVARDEEAEAIKRQSEAYDDLVKNQQRAIYAADLERESLGMSEESRKAVMLAQDLMNRAQDAGIKLTQDQTDALKDLAKESTAAEKALNDAKDEMEFTRSTAKGFFSDLRAGLVAGGNAFRTFADAALNALNRVLDRLADQAFDSLLDNIFNSNSSSQGKSAGGGFNIGSLITDILGSFDTGGFTGNAPRTAVAGVVHGGEYVVNATNTARFRPQLEAINRGVNPWGGDQGRSQSGGHIMVSGEFTVKNGNIIPTIAAVSGQVAGQQVRQANKGFGGRANEINARGV